MEFKRRLVEEAKKEHRSLTNYLEAALTRLWELEESQSVAKAAGGKRREGAKT